MGSSGQGQSVPPRVERREVYYRGTVQGVGFRYTARRIAQRYAVTGYVKNLPDGRVELVAEGPPEDLDRFLADVQNAFGSLIRQADVRRLPAKNSFPGFAIRYY